jgi:hypothetical protein
VGTYFGFHALAKRADSDNACPNNRCTAAGVSLNDEAKTSAWVANIALGAGLVGVGIGAYLLLTQHPQPPGRTATKGSRTGLVPMAAPHLGGLALIESF